MGRIKKHIVVDDMQGHTFDIYDFEIASDPDTIGLANADQLPRMESVAALGTNAQTVPTVALFYGRTAIKTSGQSSGQFHIIARRDGSPAANNPPSPRRSWVN